MAADLDPYLIFLFRLTCDGRTVAGLTLQNEGWERDATVGGA